MDRRMLQRWLNLSLLLGISLTQAGLAASPPIPASLAAIHQNPALLGKVVSVHTCFSLPMSDAPHDPANNFLVLYPCEAKLDDEAAMDKVAVLATPAADASISRAPENPDARNALQGDFIGTVTRQKISPTDASAAYVIVFKSLTHIRLGSYSRSR